MKRLLYVLSLVLLLAVPARSFAAGPVTVFVEPFTLAGAKDQQLSTMLQTMLASRLSTPQVLVQDSAKGAQVLIKGSLLQFGKVFSVDATVRTGEGAVIGRAFEQGEGDEQLPAAATKLGEKLSKFVQNYSLTQAKPAAGEARPSAVQAAPPSANPSGDIVRADAAKRGDGVVQTSHRLPGVFAGMAFLRGGESGGREILLVKDHALQVVRYGEKVESLSEVQLAGDEKILGVDTIDLDGDRVPEAYLTVRRENELVSQVWVWKDGKLSKTQEKLPYYFRVLTGRDGRGILFAQQASRDGDFFGPVYEAIWGAKGLELRNPVKLPPFGNVFNFNWFADAEGKALLVILHPDGFLVVTDPAGEELWRSDSKYGGSEVYFDVDDKQHVQITGTTYRRVFLEQRLLVRPNGEIVVPENIGTWNIGNSRSYSRNSIHAMKWNGAVLEQTWHTKTSQAYLSDYFIDEERKEIVVLEVVKKEGLLGKGASALSIKKLDQ